MHPVVSVPARKTLFLTLPALPRYMIYLASTQLREKAFFASVSLATMAATTLLRLRVTTYPRHLFASSAPRPYSSHSVTASKTFPSTTSPFLAVSSFMDLMVMVTFQSSLYILRIRLLTVSGPDVFHFMHLMGHLGTFHFGCLQPEPIPCTERTPPMASPPVPCRPLHHPEYHPTPIRSDPFLHQ